VEARLSDAIAVYPKVCGDAVACMCEGTAIVRAGCPREANCQITIMFHDPDKIDQDGKKSALQLQGTPTGTWGKDHRCQRYLFVEFIMKSFKQPPRRESKNLPEICIGLVSVIILFALLLVDLHCWTCTELAWLSISKVEATPVNC
jgi:hypothetical protein